MDDNNPIQKSDDPPTKWRKIYGKIIKSKASSEPLPKLVRKRPYLWPKYQIMLQHFLTLRQYDPEKAILLTKLINEQIMLKTEIIEGKHTKMLKPNIELDMAIKTAATHMSINWTEIPPIMVNYFFENIFINYLISYYYLIVRSSMFMIKIHKKIQ